MSVVVPQKKNVNKPIRCADCGKQISRNRFKKLTNIQQAQEFDFDRKVLCLDCARK